MTMEPNETEHRLTPVTAQNPGTERAHETHDRLLVARFAPRPLPVVGSSVRIAVQSPHLHFFDTETGRRLDAVA